MAFPVSAAPDPLPQPGGLYGSRVAWRSGRSLCTAEMQRVPIRIEVRDAVSHPRARRSAENLAIDVLVEAHQELFAHPDGGCSQIPGGAQHLLDDVLGCLATGELVELLALGDVYLSGIADQLARLGRTQLGAGRDPLLDLDVACLQELGGSSAGCSAGSVIIPVYAFGHRLSPYQVVVPSTLRCIVTYSRGGINLEGLSPLSEISSPSRRRRRAPTMVD